MRVRQTRADRRRGTTSVEMSLVLVPVLMFFFGVFEYGRFFLDRNIVNNAARGACRYAIVNNTSSTINTSVQNVVAKYMAGRNVDFSSFTVSLSGVSASTGTTYTGNNVTNLMPGDMISVTITATYSFIVPIPFISVPSTVPMNSTCTMIVEGAT